MPCKRGLVGDMYEGHVVFVPINKKHGPTNKNLTYKTGLDFIGEWNTLAWSNRIVGLSGCNVPVLMGFKKTTEWSLDAF